MKSLYCKDVCVKDCDFVIKGFREREIIRAMFYHGQKEHKEILNDMDDNCRKKITIKMHASIIKE